MTTAAYCKQCKQNLPQAAFWPFRDNKPRGFRVHFCGGCARANMAKWARTQNVGLRPEDITEA